MKQYEGKKTTREINSAVDKKGENQKVREKIAIGQPAAIRTHCQMKLSFGSTSDLES